MSEPTELDRNHCRSLLPKPASDANKYSRGCTAVIAGSARYTGAAVLATAAARCGSGYTRLITPESAAQVARFHLASIPVVSCPDEQGCFGAVSVEAALEGCAGADALVIGPGIGREAGVSSFLESVLSSCDRPRVLDADALFALAADKSLCASGAPCVLTPHAGEAARLLGRAVEDASSDAAALAQEYGCIVALKGPDTYIAAPSGEVYVYCEGTAALAKAGSGDVLAGMIGAHLAQGMNALDAAALAVYLHGTAGKLAARRLSDISVMPEDIVDNIGPAIVSLEE